MKQTSPELAAMRRLHGHAWKLTYVVEGFDEPFEKYVGGQHSKHFAKVVARIEIGRELNIAEDFIHLQSIVRD